MKNYAYLLLALSLTILAGCGEDEELFCETNDFGHVTFTNINNGFNPDSIKVHMGASYLGIVRASGTLLVNNIASGKQGFTFTFRGDTLYTDSIMITTCATTGYTIDWNPVSDQRLKQNIRPMFSVLPALMNIGTYTFEYNITGFPGYGLAGGKHYGFMAQELQQDFPELVVPFRDGYSSVRYQEMVPVLTKAIQEQQAEIAALRKELAELKQTLNKLDKALGNP